MQMVWGLWTGGTFSNVEVSFKTYLCRLYFMSAPEPTITLWTFCFVHSRSSHQQRVLAWVDPPNSSSYVQGQSTLSIHVRPRATSQLQTLRLTRHERHSPRTLTQFPYSSGSWWRSSTYGVESLSIARPGNSKSSTGPTLYSRRYLQHSLGTQSSPPVQGGLSCAKCKWPLGRRAPPQTYYTVDLEVNNKALKVVSRSSTYANRSQSTVSKTVQSDQYMLTVQIQLRFS